MLGNLRGWEWVILLLVVLLLFGARKLPDLARSVGKSMKIFKSEVKDLRSDDADPSTPGAPPAPGSDPATGDITATSPPGDGEPRQP